MDQYIYIYMHIRIYIYIGGWGVSPTGKLFLFVRRARTHRLPSEIRAQNRDMGPFPFPFRPGRSSLFPSVT